MSAWMYVAGWVLVHFVWQGALLAIGAALALHLCRRQSASVRYAIGCGSLLTMVFTVAMTAVLIPEREISSGKPTRLSLLTAPTTTGDAALPVQLDAAAGIARTLTGATDVEAWFPWIVSIWLFGVAFLLARTGSGWWRVHRLYRLASTSESSAWQIVGNRLAVRLRLNCVIRIIELPHIDVPLVVGCLRPIVVLPMAAFGHLSPAQADAILAHEVAHIRRHDYLVNLLQTLTETLFFYHPAVWWLSARIREEREHCCDDVAMSVCGDPFGYASALTELEALRNGNLSLAPGAADGSLLSRIRRILGVELSDQAQVPSWTIVLAVIAVSLGTLTNLKAVAQTSPELAAEVLKLEFEVATVKPNKSGSENSSVRLQPGGRITATNIPLRALLRTVYEVQDFQLVGGPDWLNVDRFDIEAKAGRDFPPQAAGPAIELIAMMRNLLAERFKLVVHRGTQELPVFALLVARGDGKLGPQLRRSDIDCEELARAKMKPPPAPAPTAADPRPVAPCGVRRANGRVTVRAGTMAQLASTLSGPASRFVEDRTGLPGFFDIDLEWAPDQTADTSGPSLFTALQEQLGLKLESTRAPVEVLVIDHVERPTPD
jgi:uncharacterized protein (TIGR03435 family)